MAVQSKNDLPRITGRISRALADLIKRTAFAIEAEAKTLAPVDTGLLRNSIQTNIEAPTKATIGTNVEYAPYQEFGTRHQKGKAFLTPAADKAKKKFENDAKHLERSLR